MDVTRIHLIAPAGSCRRFLESTEIGSVGRLFEIVREAVGSCYRVTGNAALIDAGEDESRDGRSDDRQRAEDIEQALADDGVAAILTLRGGAWLTRILPSIDFTVLDGRTRPVALFGFSEITTLVNIVGAHRHGRGVYDCSPAFLPYALRRYAHTDGHKEVLGDLTPRAWSEAKFLPEFRAFFADMVSMIEGRGTGRGITASLRRGRLPESMEASLIGGNLTVFTTLLASKYKSCVSPQGHWVALEDYKERPSRLDRLLAHLTLAGLWDACEGILLGDFHRGAEDETEAVLALLGHHLPRDRVIPVLSTGQFGHVWPMSPLALHVPATIKRTGAAAYTINWPPSACQTV